MGKTRYNLPFVQAAEFYEDEYRVPEKTIQSSW